MAINKIVKNSITGGAIDATKIADDAISEEHLDNSVILGNTELAETAASGDILLIYDTSSGTIKKILSSNVGLSAPTFTAVSPTNVNTGDGTGNATIVITGTNFDASATAKLKTTAGADLAFDSVTRNSSTQITGVIAISSLSNASEPYDIVIINGNGLQVTATDQMNINAQPVFVTSAGSLGSQTVSTAGSFSVNATDPESAGNVTFELQSGSLPPGFSITNTAAEGGTAIISGTDTSTSSTTTFNFVLRAVDAASNTTSRAFSIISKVPVTESFTSSGTFSVPSGVTATDLLVVAGGGGGGSQGQTYNSGPYGEGGGGAGGLVFFPSYPITPGGTVTVTVGSGGCAQTSSSQNGDTGDDSVFGASPSPGTPQVLTAKGGGGGGKHDTNGLPGGSGGGGGTDNNATGGSAVQPTQPGNSGAYGFGSNGGNAGGPSNSAGAGGGAGAGGEQGSVADVSGGSRGGQGGDGKAYSIADGTTSVYYAGGGAGAANTSQPGPGSNATGGQGGGGHSYSNFSPPGGGDGSANKGGGGGGSPATPSTPSYDGGAGGKGIVIVRI